MSELSTPDQLKTDIAHNYEQYTKEPQDRDEHGKLKDPLAQTFEARMNRSLDTYSDFVKFATQQTVAFEPVQP
jgi:hypothetical protein